MHHLQPHTHTHTNTQTLYTQHTYTYEQDFADYTEDLPTIAQVSGYAPVHSTEEEVHSQK